MRALEVIVKRNGEAAGREAAHAANDGKWSKARRISAVAAGAVNVNPVEKAAYEHGRQED